MKRRFVLALCICLMLCWSCGCNQSITNVSTTSTTTVAYTTSAICTAEETQNLVNENFSLTSFSNVEEDLTPLSDDEVRTMITKIPSDKYEAYPDRHNIPLTATLYKGNQVISIDLDDPRLIQLINFYNNAVYFNQYAYTQGVLKPEDLDLTIHQESFKLVLTYTPHGNSFPTLYDTIVVTNTGFFAICYDRSAYQGEYPDTAFGHYPLFHNYCWLNLFGF